MFLCVAVRCSVLEYVAVCCSVLQYVAVCCSVLQTLLLLMCLCYECVCLLQYVTVCCSALECVAVLCSVLTPLSLTSSKLKLFPTCRSVLQYVAGSSFIDVFVL